MILIWFNLLKIFEITSVCKFNFETRTQETIQTSIPSRHSNKEKYFHFLISSPPRPRTLYFCLAVVQSENSDHYCRRQDPGPGWRAFNGNFLFRLIDGKWPQRIRDIKVEIYQKMASQIISQRKSFAFQGIGKEKSSTFYHDVKKVKLYLRSVEETLTSLCFLRQQIGIQLPHISALVKTEMDSRKKEADKLRRNTLFKFSPLKMHQKVTHE